ncbi:HU family DNA-binding protein [Candidatus Phytoplasma bonamiae]|uniref:HU family DNA-binding protein n=1 Tax=Candidatus Phytoplasma bonamiae TaxID=2982626 RepID=A0ABT9D6X6_9MOLU|nr:HU family DNA-binding protein ['Bonamia sp.' little leaf phytoplasma]MDO8063989.1 HU family DNA-binding protein ['Bonamia sp.' little leaf phytoplasma]MDV3174501.1 HU family DNA-binding protein ['Bonamia sp.' little leaf phytoplasma]
MNKAELISKVAKETNIKKKDVVKVFQSLYDAMGETLNKKEKFTLPYLGFFKMSYRKSRKFKIPTTSEIRVTPPQTVPTFKMSTKVKRDFKKILSE